MSMISRGEAFLGRRVRSAMSEPCVYRRKSGGAELTVNVAFGKRAMQVSSGEGAVFMANVTTGIISSGELDGEAPKTGDRITRGAKDKWVVRLPGGNAPWEYVGTTKEMIRGYLRRDDEEDSAG